MKKTLVFSTFRCTLQHLDSYAAGRCTNPRQWKTKGTSRNFGQAQGNSSAWFPSDVFLPLGFPPNFPIAEGAPVKFVQQRKARLKICTKEFFKRYSGKKLMPPGIIPGTLRSSAGINAPTNG